MRPRKLAMALEPLDGFRSPDPALEQYATPADVASRILAVADGNGDLDGTVVDLGTGAGVLAAGAALLGASVVGVEIDRGPLDVARSNLERLDVADDVHLVRGDVAKEPLGIGGATVVMNPPFGAQRRGADRAFLDAAERIADVIYTVHNEGSRSFVDGYVDGEITHAFEATVTLPATQPFHTEDRRDVRAEVYRIVV